MKTLLAAIAMVVLCVSAHAHRLNLFATATDGLIAGNAYFSDERPAKGLAVQAFAPDGALLGETKTNGDGRFEYRPPSPSGVVVLKAISGDGHAAEFTVSAEELSGAPAAPEVATTPTVTGGNEDAIERIVDEAVARQVRPLREQLDAFERQVRIRDVIGGIGYIVGAVGLVALLKARKGNGRS